MGTIIPTATPTTMIIPMITIITITIMAITTTITTHRAP